MYQKNICDGVGSQNGSIDTPLDSPLFWLDNIFKDKITFFFSIGRMFLIQGPENPAKSWQHWIVRNICILDKN